MGVLPDGLNPAAAAAPSGIQAPDGGLQLIEKTAGLLAVHLNVVKLKGHLQPCPQAPAAVSAPDEKRVVEQSAVKIDNAVQSVLARQEVPITILSGRL